MNTMTYKALDIAKWFLLNDVDKTLFNKELTSKNAKKSRITI